jgi:HK97 family phage major capsid protein
LQGKTALWSDAERAAVAEIENTRIRQESRAALSAVGTAGGFLIPFFLDPAVIVENAGAVNPFRSICRQELIPSNVWHGVSSQGVTASFSGEASEMTDNSPTFEQPTITPIRATAFVQASWEVAMDAVNLAAEVGMLFSDAKNNLEATKFTTGSGSTEPYGIITRLGLVTASRVAAQTNGSFGAVDVYSMVNNLPARAQNNAQWMAHWGIANLARQFAGTALNSSFWVDFGQGIPSTLLGAPFHQNSAMTASLSAATASNDDILVIGDWSKYVIVDRIGMEIVDVPVILGANKRPTGERGWACWWRTGADVTGTADSFFRMLRV